MRLQSKYWLLMAFLPLFTIPYVSFFGQAFAQELEEPAEGYIQRNALVWGLFYELMVAAFSVGAVVNAVIVYVMWRYREGHKKNRLYAEEAEEDIER